jgi:hypothetical protein
MLLPQNVQTNKKVGFSPLISSVNLPVRSRLITYDGTKSSATVMIHPVTLDFNGQVFSAEEKGVFFKGILRFSGAKRR